MDLFNGDSKISIITKMKIRYEGELVSLNNVDKSVVLRNVRSFGTQNRRPGQEIPPNSAIYDMIHFKSSDIEDMKQTQSISPAPLSAPAPPNAPQPQTAPVSNAPEKTFAPPHLESQKPTEQNQESAPKYNNTGFFDNINSSVTSRNVETREDRNIQYNKDVDTFGRDDVSNQIKTDRMRRNRGGFNNNNYSNNGGGYHGGAGRPNNNRTYYNNNGNNNYNNNYNNNSNTEMNSTYNGGYQRQNNYTNNNTNTNNNNNYNRGGGGRGRGRGGYNNNYNNNNNRRDYQEGEYRTKNNEPQKEVNKEGEI